MIVIIELQVIAIFVMLLGLFITGDPNYFTDTSLGVGFIRFLLVVFYVLICYFWIGHRDNIRKNLGVTNPPKK